MQNQSLWGHVHDLGHEEIHRTDNWVTKTYLKKQKRRSITQEHRYTLLRVSTLKVWTLG